MTFKKLVNERTGDIKYGCLEINLYNISNWNEILKIIDKDDVYEKEGYGLETNPHLTILYGFHDSVNSLQVFERFKKYFKLNQIVIFIKGISLFELDEYDVVKFDVILTKSLYYMNKVMKSFPYTNDYNNYIPHVTLAYIKKGQGNKYVRKFKNPKRIIGKRLVFSSKNGNKTMLNLE